MENFKVQYDQTVRDASGNIIQFMYGDDGFDAVNIVRLKIPLLLEPLNRYALNYKDEIAVLREKGLIKKAVIYLTQWKADKGEQLVSCPVDFEAMFERAKILSEGQTLQLSVNTIWTRCWNFISKIKNELLYHYLVLFLQIRRMMELNDVFFEWFLKSAEEIYNRALVAPGEMVGVLAGQSK